MQVMKNADIDNCGVVSLTSLSEPKLTCRLVTGIVECGRLHLVDISNGRSMSSSWLEFLFPYLSSTPHQSRQARYAVPVPEADIGVKVVQFLHIVELIYFQTFRYHTLAKISIPI